MRIECFGINSTNRAQHAKNKSIYSRIKDLGTNVSKESILGPPLFIIYMNDIHTMLSYRLHCTRMMRHIRTLFLQFEITIKRFECEPY